MLFKKNDVKTSWEALKKIHPHKVIKKRTTWVYKQVQKVNHENSLFEKILKFLIFLSLFVSINNKRLKNPYKRKQIVELTYEKISTPGFSFIPAGLGFYLFLSLIPISIITMSFISLNPEWARVLSDDILQRLIPGFNSMIITFKPDNVLESATSVLFIITLLWFSSRGIMKFVDSQSNIYNHPINTNYLIRRIRATLIVVLVSIFSIIALLSYIPLIIFYKQSFAPKSVGYEILFYFSTFIFLSIWTYIGLALLYRFSPLYKIKFQQIFPGILITLIPSVIFAMSFGYFSSTYINFDKFGTIGTFFYSIIFMQIFSYFLYAGIIINSSYYKIYYSTRISSKKWVLSMKFLNWIDYISKKNR